MSRWPLSPISMGTGAYGGLFLDRTFGSFARDGSDNYVGPGAGAAFLHTFGFSAPIHRQNQLWPLYLPLADFLSTWRALSASRGDFVCSCGAVLPIREKPFLRLKDRPVRAVAPVVVAAG